MEYDTFNRVSNLPATTQLVADLRFKQSLSLLGSVLIPWCYADSTHLPALWRPEIPHHILAP